MSGPAWVGLFILCSGANKILESDWLLEKVSEIFIGLSQTLTCGDPDFGDFLPLCHERISIKTNYETKTTIKSSKSHFSVDTKH